ncbi:MAG: ATP-binding protein [Alphaproteobacteria bacterium]
MSQGRLVTLLARMADALDRLAPKRENHVLPESGETTGQPADDAYIWTPETGRLAAVSSVNRIDLALIKGVNRQRETLLENTRRFALGYPANNALLWGARGMGKSSLVKAVHAAVNDESQAGAGRIALVEIHREDIATLPDLLKALRNSRRRCLLFCDDLSFDLADTGYKSLKAVLEGGIEGRPHNVLFYATSNRRHLMPRDMIENERSTAISPSESVEEKVSLSDRFGLWLGFHPCDQDIYLEIVRAYAAYFDLGDDGGLEDRSLEWAMTRGARSGRVAWQFIQDEAGRQGRILSPTG